MLYQLASGHVIPQGGSGYSGAMLSFIALSNKSTGGQILQITPLIIIGMVYEPFIKQFKRLFYISCSCATMVIQFRFSDELNNIH